MAKGPGKYDNECQFVMGAARAQAVLLLVIGGDKGSGFSFTGPVAMTSNVPKMLRDVADQIEEDVANG